MSDARDPGGGQRFIVGMPRAATTWICKCLNEHPDIVAFGESTFWGRRYVEPENDGRYSDAMLTNIVDRIRSAACLHSVLGDGPGCLKHLDQNTWATMVDAERDALPERPTPAEVFRWMCELVEHGEAKTTSVEKTPHHLNALGRIDAAMPGSRYCIMVREPYGFMLSYKHQGDRKPDDIRRRFRRRYHPVLAALVWKSCMRRALNAKAQFGDRALVVRHEDIEHNADAVLADVQAFFNAAVHPLADRVPRDNTSFPLHDRPELHGDDRFWLHRIAGAAMSDAGYKQMPGRREPLRIAWSIIRLPWWILWNLLNLRRFLSGSVFTYVWNWLRPSTETSLKTP